MTNTTDPDVLILGGGIIGVASAYFLAQQGVSTMLVEKGEIAAGSSYGNAGLICPCHSDPMPAPGVLTQGIRWLLDPESPFYIRPRLDLGLARWLWRFQSFCTQEAVDRAIPFLRDMQRASRQLYRELIAAEGIECHFQPSGGLTLYITEKKWATASHSLAEAQRFGLRTVALSGDEVRQLEPAVHPNVVGGLHHLEDAHIDPALFVVGLAEAARRQGAILQTGTTVIGLENAGNRITTVHTDQGSYRPQQVVLAAGAWSAELVRTLGIDIPLQPAKGYSITMKRPPISPNLHLHLAEAKMVVTPMGARLRYAGTLELTGFDAGINQRRVNAIRRNAAAYLRQSGEPEVVEVWGGVRPCSPDGLPYLGRSRCIANLIVATGHAMLGMSMGPISGRLVSQLASGQPPEIDLALADPQRFINHAVGDLLAGEIC